MEFLQSCADGGLFKDIMSLEILWPPNRYSEILALLPSLTHLRLVLPREPLKAQGTPKRWILSGHRIRSLGLIQAPESNGAQDWLRTDAAALLRFTDFLATSQERKFDELVLTFVKLGSGGETREQAAEKLSRRFDTVNFRLLDSRVAQLW